MFLLRRPTAATIQRFLDASRALPLSYERPDQVDGRRVRMDVDVAEGRIGEGRDAFARACAALTAWRHFDLGWTDTYPTNAPVAVGTVVAVAVRHLGFWSLNGARVVSLEGSPSGNRFGFTYATLTNHAEAGDELFEVALDDRTGGVDYRIRATSAPRAALARLGRPYVRHLQARFRRDSLAAMRRALRA